jgi:PAS domain S-box-containing protein
LDALSTVADPLVDARGEIQAVSFNQGRRRLPAIREGRLALLDGAVLDGAVLDRAVLDRAALRWKPYVMSTSGLKEQAFHRVIEDIPEPVVVIDRLGQVLFANAAAKSVLAAHDSQLPDNPFGFSAACDQAEVSLREADGKSSVRRVCVAQTEWQGEPAWVAALPDVTESNRVEESLRKSEARQRAILESTLDCVVVMDASECILEFNSAAERTFGYRRDEVLGRPMADMLIPAGLREPFRRNLIRCLETGSERVFDQRVEVTAMRKGGSEFPSEAAISVARQGGEPIFTAVLHDITQRKQDHEELLRQTQFLEHAVEALERVRERERQVLAAIPLILIGLDSNGIVTHWNPAAEQHFGSPVEQVIGKRLIDLPMRWPDNRINETIANGNQLREAARFDELRVSDARGRERILALTINRIEARDNKDCGVVLVGTDITGRKAMEAQLMLAQKMESIGQLAAGIAHEINTPTQYVNDNTRFLRDSFRGFQQLLDLYERLRAEAKRGPVPAALLVELDGLVEHLDLGFLAAEIPKAIDQSLEGIGRVAEIVHAMKQFSHPDQVEPELVDLNKAIANTATVARNEWKYVAEMELDLDADLPAVPCLAGRFNQVILNLIVNAAQAIGDVVAGSGAKGKIRIATRTAGDHVEIRVADTGTGIPAAIRNRIFDPFFTTKQVGKGTGQGLAIAHNIIVEQHGGAIDVESEDGKGSTFLLRLPLRASRPRAEHNP